MIKNQAGQVVTANLVALADGESITSGTVTVKVLGDGGTKAVGLGTIENEGDGTWSYFPTAAETNYAAVTYSFSHDDALRVDVQFNPISDDSVTGSCAGSCSTGGTGGGGYFGAAYFGALTSSAPAQCVDPLLLAASEPRSVTVDGVNMQQHSLPDVIALDKYLKGKAAAKSPTRGLRFTKLVPPGAVSGR